MTLYNDWRAAGSVVVSAWWVSVTTVGLLYAVKNDFAPDLGSTANVASSSGAGMSMVHSVKTMSYLSVCAPLLPVFGSSAALWMFVPAGSSCAWRWLSIWPEAGL